MPDGRLSLPKASPATWATVFPEVSGMPAMACLAPRPLGQPWVTRSWLSALYEVSRCYGHRGEPTGDILDARVAFSQSPHPLVTIYVDTAAAPPSLPPNVAPHHPSADLHRPNLCGPPSRAGKHVRRYPRPRGDPKSLSSQPLCARLYRQAALGRPPLTRAVVIS